MNAGTRLKNLSACFVLPIRDHLCGRDGILDTLVTAATIHAEGGGTGFDFSDLRPEGSLVSSTHGTTSGPVSFMKMYDAVTDSIKQGGKRRGANMGVLRVDHPDILKFVRCKTKEGDIENFNISVAITDRFLLAVEADEEFELSYNHRELSPIRMRARDLMSEIVERAWNNGEPGLIFIDTVNRLSEYSEPIKATNPCGEIPVPDNVSCNLGSINISQCYSNGSLDIEKFRQMVRLGIRFLDNVITVNRFVNVDIERAARKYRPLGLGIMGWADFLLKCKIQYGSPESYSVIDFVMRLMYDEARIASDILLSERGSNEETGKQRRNASILSIAPTGTLSIIANCSSSIEPNFAWSYDSHRVDSVLHHTHPLAQSYLVRSLPLPPYFVVASEIPAKEHVLTQAEFQKYVDHSIAKTINLPITASKKDVEDIFLLAWKIGCKGITVYRDGSRKEQVLVSEQTKANRAKNQKCLICETNLEYNGKCWTCPNCGTSGCEV